jgi:hypothetical protein
VPKFSNAIAAFTNRAATLAEDDMKALDRRARPDAGPKV